MTDGILLGVDAGTSVIKSVAFDMQGNFIASCSQPNEYTTLDDGGVEQNMHHTWQKTAATLRDLNAKIAHLNAPVLALAVTGQGDGTWLVDESGEPVHDAWLWLDARSSKQASAIESSDDYALIYEQTGTGVNVCQMRTQLNWIQENTPQLLAKAYTSFHCKDYLYQRLTGVRATDPSEGVFTFGDIHTGDYSQRVIAALGLSAHEKLLPPIVNGIETTHKLTAKASEQTGLPAGLPVCLGYVDVICTALGGGLLDNKVSPGMTILGTTGVHMRYCSNATNVSLGADRTGYTMMIPDGGYAQLQSNMAATLNIDWMLDLARSAMTSQRIEKSRQDLLEGMDSAVLAATPAKALYHPYISTAGERGPFTNPSARANFFGLDQSMDYFDLMRCVYEGLAFAARDCYENMGTLPDEIRVSGGAAGSNAILLILASVLNRPVRVVDRVEAGATGAVMIAAVQQGLYSSLADCAAVWVDPHIGQPIEPDSTLVDVYERLFPHYVKLRTDLDPLWLAFEATKSKPS